MKQLFYFMLLSLAMACETGTGSENNSTAEKSSMPVKALSDSFEEVNVVKMHFFGTKEEMLDGGKYPYVGKIISEDGLKLLADDLQPNEEGGVYACYRTENSGHYILRVPGKNAFSALVLAKWDETTGKLIKVQDLAYLYCVEGICDQQDAWLADLDDSRTLELIIRKQSRDMDGNVLKEAFIVLTDDGNGNFIKTGEQLTSLAVKENYVLH